jgi:hypothetical protein
MSISRNVRIVPALGPVDDELISGLKPLADAIETPRDRQVRRAP